MPSGFITRPGCGLVPGVKVTADGSTVPPLIESLPSTLGVVLPLPPLTGPKVSSVATITGAVTTTVATALSQLLGLVISQIVYGYSYEPAGVPGAIVIVPSGFITRPGFGLVPGVRVMSAGTTGAPLSVSLTSTLGVVPPSKPPVGGKLSFTASITGAFTTTVAMAVSQLLGLSSSQIVYG